MTAMSLCSLCRLTKREWCLRVSTHIKGCMAMVGTLRGGSLTAHSKRRFEPNLLPWPG